MCIEGIVVKRQLMPVSVSQSVTAEYPSIGSYNPEKAGYMDTQLSPANVLRTRNTYMSYLPCVC